MIVFGYLLLNVYFSMGRKCLFELHTPSNEVLCLIDQTIFLTQNLKPLEENAMSIYSVKSQKITGVDSQQAVDALQGFQQFADSTNTSTLA